MLQMDTQHVRQQDPCENTRASLTLNLTVVRLSRASREEDVAVSWTSWHRARRGYDGRHVARCDVHALQCHRIRTERPSRTTFTTSQPHVFLLVVLSYSSGWRTTRRAVRWVHSAQALGISHDGARRHSHVVARQQLGCEIASATPTRAAAEPAALQLAAAGVQLTATLGAMMAYSYRRVC